MYIWNDAKITSVSWVTQRKHSKKKMIALNRPVERFVDLSPTVEGQVHHGMKTAEQVF
jgi:hypothetical protein